jgi:hypothetical protein
MSHLFYVKNAKKPGELANNIPVLLPASTEVLLAVKVAPPVALQLEIISLFNSRVPLAEERVNGVLPNAVVSTATPACTPLVLIVPIIKDCPLVTFKPLLFSVSAVMVIVAFGAL